MARARRTAVLTVAALAVAACLSTSLACFGLMGLWKRSLPKMQARKVEYNFDENGKLPGDITRLMNFAHAGDVGGVKELVAAGDAIDEKDKYGWTALRYSVRNGNLDVAAALLECGADANVASDSGRTPLMSAAENGLLEMVELLIGDGGADIMQHDEKGRTAFDMASTAAIRELVAEGQTAGSLTKKQEKKYKTEVPL